MCCQAPYPVGFRTRGGDALAPYSTGRLVSPLWPLPAPWTRRQELSRRLTPSVSLENIGLWMPRNLVRVTCANSTKARSPDDVSGCSNGQNSVEALAIQALFTQSAHEPLGDAVALGLPDEGGGGPDAEEPHLAQKVSRHVLAAVVVAESQAPGPIGADLGKVPLHPLPDRLQSGEAVDALGHVPTHDVVDAVVDRSEEPHPAVLFGLKAGAVGASDLIGLGGPDRWVMDPGVVLVADPGRGQQTGLPHQPQHPVLADLQPQPSPHLAIALAVELGIGQHLPDPVQQIRIGGGGPLPSLAHERWPAPRRGPESGCGRSVL